MRNKPIRGFKNLVGETIVKVDATAINIVTFLTASGKIVEINGDEQHCGIAVLRADDVTDIWEP